MATTSNEPTFLPLTLSTACTISRDPGSPRSAREVHWSAIRADAAAAEAWATLLAGCANTGRHQLPRRLRELCTAAGLYAGPTAPANQSRINRAGVRITEAVTDRDGADFAEAFVGFDQAVATVLARALTRLESPAR